MHLSSIAADQDQVHRANRTRNSNSLGKLRHSTELASSCTSKARIKVISTKLPSDFFYSVKASQKEEECDKLGIDSEFVSREITPHFSKRRSQRGLKMPDFLGKSREIIIQNRASYRESVYPLRRHPDIVSRPSKIRQMLNKRQSNNQQQICSFLHDVIQLSTSLKKHSKNSESKGKKYNTQIKRSIFNRQIIELPPLLQRNYPNSGFESRL